MTEAELVCAFALLLYFSLFKNLTLELKLLAIAHVLTLALAPLALTLVLTIASLALVIASFE